MSEYDIRSITHYDSTVSGLFRDDPIMTKIILLEYFTSQSSILKSKNKEILGSDVRLVRVFQGIWIDFSLRNGFCR